MEVVVVEVVVIDNAYYLSIASPSMDSRIESTNGMQHIDNSNAKTKRHHAPATASSAYIKVRKNVLRSIVRTARDAK